LRTFIVAYLTLVFISVDFWHFYFYTWFHTSIFVVRVQGSCPCIPIFLLSSFMPFTVLGYCLQTCVFPPGAIFFFFLSSSPLRWLFGDELASLGKVLWMSAYTTVSGPFAVAWLVSQHRRRRLVSLNDWARDRLFWAVWRISGGDQRWVTRRPKPRL